MPPSLIPSALYGIGNAPSNCDCIMSTIDNIVVAWAKMSFNLSRASERENMLNVLTCVKRVNSVSMYLCVTAAVHHIW